MERSLLPTSSNKVTVECYDPSNIFSTFKSQLLKHLPLRNLHWKSTNRPLRSIDTLHVDLLPAKDGTDPNAAPERRHQIPGLRQTPYLKIFLLRCDDNETYKSTSRKQLKDWTKSNPLPGEGKKLFTTQDNHDACEWLIVHLVYPDTPAALQSQTLKVGQLGSTDSTESVNKSKWPGKSSSTILEKLRTDFNRSSKSRTDRVAQIRLPKSEPQISAEPGNQHQELVEKLKATILASFDLRVRQYEDDIRLKDSQRNLPGWNFNTFFILKEGLAKGFEHVGLFEDALVGYDELALGLELVVEEQAKPETADHGGRFRPFGEELKDKIEACLQDADEGNNLKEQTRFEDDADPAGRLQRRHFTLDANRDACRDLILANDISVFDFRLYIFSRQLDLLLRSANVYSLSDDEADPNDAERKEHFLPLAEACQRAIDFITNAARALRYDLKLALAVEESDAPDEKSFRDLVATNFVISWTYTSALQILNQTSSPNLELAPIPSPGGPAPLMASGLPPISAPSLGRIGSAPPWSPFRMSSPIRLSLNDRSSIGESNTIRAKGKTGAEELAGARCELFLLARAAIETIGKKKGWESLWKADHDAAEEIDLNSNNVRESVALESPIAINGLQNGDLRNLFHSKEAFASLFSCLTTFVYRHSVAAKRTMFVQRSLGEMAILRFKAGDYEAAASHLSNIVPFYSQSRWTALETTFLAMHADCLKRLGRYGAYVSSLVKFLGQKHDMFICGSELDKDTYLNDLWEYSSKLTTPLTAKFTGFFSLETISPHIRHFQDRDGFFISLKIKFFHGSVKVANGIQMKLSPIHDSALPVIELKTGPVTIDGQPGEVNLESNVSLCGAWYAIDSIQISIGNVVFLEDYRPARLSPAVDDEGAANSYSSLRFFLYSSQRCLRVNARPGSNVHLAKLRSMQLDIQTESNHIVEGKLSIKSATAGLRLCLHEATLDLNGDVETARLSNLERGAQAIDLTDIPANSTLGLLIPYSLESLDLPVLNAKLDIEYTTTQGSFLHSSVVALNTILPISVNVQDLFQKDALVSRFTISPATLVPLRLWKWKMQDASNVLKIDSHASDEDPHMDVFPKQPASLLYKFTHTNAAPTPSLTLSVEYSCLDEVVLKAIEKSFVAFVKSSPIADLIEPLSAHLVSSFRSQWTAQDLEVIGSCLEIDVWPFEDLGWEAVLVGFSKTTCVLAKTWLEKWHSQNSQIMIYDEAKDADDIPRRLIVVPVDIPTPELVVTLCFELQAISAQTTVVGKALMASLSLSWTREWARVDSSTAEAMLEIDFEVQASPDNWVIGGMKKGTLETTSVSPYSCPILLVPQRTGHLILPAVDIKCRSVPGAARNSSLPAEGVMVPCEVDARSLSESVHVVSGFEETVVEMDVESEAYIQPNGERNSWLIRTKERNVTSSM